VYASGNEGKEAVEPGIISESKESEELKHLKEEKGKVLKCCFFCCFYYVYTQV